LAEMLNVCEYDYVALGNHDFNFGQKTLYDYLDGLNATPLCENLQDCQGEVLFPHKIHTLRNGLRVGLVGMVTDFVKIWEKPENIEGMHFVDPIESARKALNQLRDKVDITMGIYHGGFERDLESNRLLSDTRENVACEICEELDFDILLTGHQHMTITGQYYSDTYIIQPPQQGQGYAYLELEKKGERLEISSEIRQPQSPFKLNPALGQFAHLEAKLQEWLDVIVGELPEPLSVGERVEMALKGSPLADLFNRLQLIYSGAEISATSLANDAKGLPRTIRRRDLFAAYPYANTFVVLEITGEKLRGAVERSASYLSINEEGELEVDHTFLKPKVEHYNYDFYAGIEKEIDYNYPMGSRVQSLKYKGVEVKGEDQFTICINDYRASGAGGYGMYPKCKVIKEVRVEMIEMLLDYFSNKV